MPALWHAPTTTAGDRQAIARLVLDHVAVQVDGERVEVACHWAGGVQTQHATTRHAAGWRPPKRDGFDAAMVQRLVFRHGLGSGRPIWSSNVARTPGAEWTLQEAAQRLGVHQATIYRWLRGGRLRGRMAERGEQRIWLVQMSGKELDQVKAASHPARTNIWDYLRDNKLSNSVFDTYDTTVDRCCAAWTWLMEAPDRIRSLATTPWTKTVKA